MASPAIILNQNEVLLKQSVSVYGIVMDDSPFIFGTVEIVNDLDGENEVGNNVLFDPNQATRFSFDGNIYYLVTVDKIHFTEIPPV